ncbi:MAG TPA: hypothetical protein VE569_00575 [Acidimicrobiia bacterium]|nr:hypothetical protein [Acidimicrobiia bacterium]
MIALIASVILGGVFGTATATVESIADDVMVVDIKVEVTANPVTVVAHLDWDNQDLVLPLLERGDGVYGIRTELARRNYFVAFEVIGSQNSVSQPVSLIQMGADLSVGSSSTTTASDEPEPQSTQMLWLAVALGAASLSALAFWVLGGREETDDVQPDEPEAVSDEEE